MDVDFDFFFHFYRSR